MLPLSTVSLPLPLVKLYGKPEFHQLVPLQLQNTNIKILKFRWQIRIPHAQLPLIKLYGNSQKF